MGDFTYRSSLVPDLRMSAELHCRCVAVAELTVEPANDSKPRCNLVQSTGSLSRSVAVRQSTFTGASQEI